MNKWLKRIRGALGMELAWAAAWFVVGAIFGLVAGIASVVTGVGAGLIFGSALFFSVLFGMCGFLGGAAFSVVLGITEGRRRFDEMSLPRFAGFGALGSLPLSALYFSMVGWGGGLDAVLVVVVLTLLGMASATGSLRLARWADDRALLKKGEDVADIGLTEAEKGELLGT